MHLFSLLKRYTIGIDNTDQLLIIKLAKKNNKIELCNYQEINESVQTIKLKLTKFSNSFVNSNLNSNKLIIKKFSLNTRNLTKTQIIGQIQISSKQLFHIEATKIIIDYHILDIKNILVFAIAREHVAQQYKVLQQKKIKLNCLEPSSLALKRLLKYQKKWQNGILLIHFNSQYTQIIYKQNENNSCCYNLKTLTIKAFLPLLQQSLNFHKLQNFSQILISGNFDQKIILILETQLFHQQVNILNPFKENMIKITDITATKYVLAYGLALRGCYGNN